MRVLRRLPPTPEQINIVRRIQSGVTLIRGAAGSGKTSTALIALRATTGTTVAQLRSDNALPANVLVLAFNRSIRGYIASVAEDELADYADDVRLYVLTFDKWAYSVLGYSGPLQIERAQRKLNELALGFPRDHSFVLDEVDYVMGRFLPKDYQVYCDARRDGRGQSPQMDKPLRQRLLDEIVYPYRKWKKDKAIKDFYDIACEMIDLESSVTYDVIVLDETQDLTANQLRAVIKHCAADATITIVTDSTQRIYPRGATWQEAGINILPSRSFRLQRNYRNTRQIAALAAAIASGLPTDDDGSIPDPKRCTSDGSIPLLLRGTYPQQLAYVISQIEKIDLASETVGFLHLKAGGWFKEVRKQLKLNGHGCCEIQGAQDWPEHAPNIGLSSFHSAKGLEFDHVFMIGLSDEQVSYGSDDQDDRYGSLRRLLAMGVGRAKKSLIMGVEPGKELTLLEIIDPKLLTEIVL